MSVTAIEKPWRATAEELAEELERAVTLADGPAAGDGYPPTAILLISHGSRAAAWRRMLLDVHADTARKLLSLPGVREVRSAFMEYTEPSIATQLRAFDEAGIERIITVPLLLTISDHSFDDIPTICGLAHDPDRIAELTAEGIEIHRPMAEIIFAPLLDFSDLVRRNLARRLRAILGWREDPAGDQMQSGNRQRTGLVLVGYGSAEFEDEWNRFFGEIRSYAEAELGISQTAHSWCGHLVNYDRRPTMRAIDGLLEANDRVVVMPIFVAFDPMFQNSIIGRAVERSSDPDRVLYRPDAILPEPAVGHWVVDVSRRMIRQSAPPTPSPAVQD